MVVPAASAAAETGAGSTRSWKSPRQVGVDELHGAHDLVDLLAGGALDVAHGGRFGESHEGARPGPVALQVVDEGGGPDAVADACRGSPWRRRGRPRPKRGCLRSGGGMPPIRSSSPKRTAGCWRSLEARASGRVSSPRVMTGPPPVPGSAGSMVLVVVEPPPPPQAARARRPAAPMHAGEDGNQAARVSSVHGAAPSEMVASAPAGAGPLQRHPKREFVRPHLFAQAREATPMP